MTEQERIALQTLIGEMLAGSELPEGMSIHLMRPIVCPYCFTESPDFEAAKTHDGECKKHPMAVKLAALESELATQAHAVMRAQERAETAEAQACRMREALEQIRALDFAFDAKGLSDFYSGPTRFVTAWLTAAAALAASSPCQHEQKICALGTALEMLYDKYENGDPCYEDVEDLGGFMGNAVDLSDEEETQVFRALESAGIATVLRAKEGLSIAAPKCPHAAEVERTEERDAALTLAEPLDRLYEWAKRTIRADIQSPMEIMGEYESLREERDGMLAQIRALNRAATEIQGERDGMAAALNSLQSAARAVAHYHRTGYGPEVHRRFHDLIDHLDAMAAQTEAATAKESSHG